MSLKKLNYLLMVLSFVLPFLLYLKTMAPTVSLWDCGEFIATSIIMGIPHPPGTPLYLIIGNFFSQLPLLSDLGARVNLISPIASALSVMFLYLIILYLIEQFHKEKDISIYLASFIGALTFAVTDSHWFNAVEAEVYALSTLFTAIVVWLILKWSREIKFSNQVKYLILIFYCMGLAIGIHLLNLLAIPFITLIIYFKLINDYNKQVNFSNWTIMSFVSGLCFIIIYKGIIKGLPSIINKTQSLSILFLFFVIIILSTIFININWPKKINYFKHIAISCFSFMLIFITINELTIENYRDKINSDKSQLEYQLMQLEQEVYDKVVNVNNSEAREYWLSVYQQESEEINTEIKNVDSAIDKIKKDGLNYFQLLQKQSSTSIFILFASLLGVLLLLFNINKNKNISTNTYHSISQLIINCMFMVLVGYSTYTLIFIRAQQNPQINYNNPHDIKSAYEYINRDQYGQWDILDRKTSMLINSQQNHESWKRYTKDIQNPTSEEITKFVWHYQFKEMYLRYFGWQFIGKEDWNQKTWTRNSIDNEQLISMPPLQGVDIFRYGLPFAFLIGMFGLFYHFRKDPHRALSVLSLFILTGLAIVVYLNQSDPQPRERDYAFVGSFFAFSIWIGIGCYGLIDFLTKKSQKIYDNENNKIYLSILLMIFMPLLMGYKDYYEHDRSQRYEAWDYAYNLLNSCDENGILFTNGDNDTFPLWYLQYVEKIRTDVKVVNLSLLNFPSYIRQLDDHKPSLNLFEKDDKFLEAIDSEDMELLTTFANQNYLNDNYPNVYIKSDHNKELNWEFKNGTYGLGLTNISIMKIIEECFGERPIYFSVTTGNNQLGLDEYLLQEGLVYKLTNKINNSPRPINMNMAKTTFLIDSIYKFRNLNKSGIFYGPHIERIAAVYRNVFQETANHMVVNLNENNNIQKSYQIRERLNYYIPSEIVPETEQMKAYRNWEYYDGIIRYCMFQKKYNDGISNDTKEFIKNKLPDLFDYLYTQFPEIFINDK